MPSKEFIDELVKRQEGVYTKDKDGKTIKRPVDNRDKRNNSTAAKFLRKQRDK